MLKNQIRFPWFFAEYWLWDYFHHAPFDIFTKRAPEGANGNQQFHFSAPRHVAVTRNSWQSIDGRPVRGSRTNPQLVGLPSLFQAIGA